MDEDIFPFFVFCSEADVVCIFECYVLRGKSDPDPLGF